RPHHLADAAPRADPAVAAVVARAVDQRLHRAVQGQLDRQRDLRGRADQAVRVPDERDQPLHPARHRYLGPLPRDEPAARGAGAALRTRAREGRRMIRLAAVTKRFGDRTLFAGFDLELERGRTTVITGRSGCGKSTLLRLFNQLERHDAGTVAVD